MLLRESPWLLRYPEPRLNHSPPVSLPLLPRNHLWNPAVGDQTWGVIPRCLCEPPLLLLSFAPCLSSFLSLSLSLPTLPSQDPCVDDQTWGVIARCLWDSPLLLDAVKVAGSFRAYAIQKKQHMQQGVAEWKTPCEYEMQVWGKWGGTCEPWWLGGKGCGAARPKKCMQQGIWCGDPSAVHLPYSHAVPAHHCLH